jgi:glyoxylase-like metal-dependent hydrolase (beta-lactamase superfamily II)
MIVFMPQRAVERLWQMRINRQSLLKSMILAAIMFCPEGTRGFSPRKEGQAKSSSPEIRAEKGMKITIVYDNNPYDPRLRSDWGFSCLVSFRERAILFDTGGDGGILLENMKKLGIDPKGISTVLLSHIHGDHVGGLPAFLRQNSKVTVYVPGSFPADLKKKSGIGGHAGRSEPGQRDFPRHFHDRRA